MPAAICNIASVMTKRGIPIRVIPNAFTIPSARQGAGAISIAAQPGNGEKGGLPLNARPKGVRMPCIPD
jgi:hypothetical protein